MCVTGRLNSVSSDSHGHGRVDPAATGTHLWEQGTPNGTGGISSIFKDNLGNRGHRADQGWRRTDLHRWANGVCYIGIRTVYTSRIGGKKERKKKRNWDVNAKASDEEFIHARQLVPAGAVYLLLPKYYCRGRTPSDCTANTAEAPIHF